MIDWSEVLRIPPPKENLRAIAADKKYFGSRNLGRYQELVRGNPSMFFALMQLSRRQLKKFLSTK